MGNEITVHRLPKGETTKWGAFYAQVDGRNVGDPDRPFWKTHKQAKACGDRFIEHVSGGAK